MLKDKIAEIIGEYTPRTYADGVLVGGVAGLDIEYIVRAVLLIVAIWGISMLLVSLTKSFRRL